MLNKRDVEHVKQFSTRIKFSLHFALFYICQAEEFKTFKEIHNLESLEITENISLAKRVIDICICVLES